MTSTVRTTADDGNVRIALEGHLDAGTGDTLLEALRSELEQQPARVDIDLSVLESFASDGAVALSRCRDLCRDLPDGLHPDDDTWYFPRVCGTFKERAGFHGCQMPEQLLGRIIRTCSREGEIVLDPFTGSGTTLAVAKKLSRAYLGFELSSDYVTRGEARLAVMTIGDPLKGAPEPTMSAPSTLKGKRDVPIVMVTARADTHDVVAGLEAGADDYLTKPFAPKELSAPIRALMRRARKPESGNATMRFGDLEIIPDAGVVRRAGTELHLTKTEFRLLCELASSPGRVFSREVLLERVWGYGYFGDGRLVDVHVRRLRTKIESDPANPRHVATVRGLGYKLQG